MRIVQLFGDESHGWTLSKYAYVPIDPKLTSDNTELGRKRLGEAILGAVEQAGIKTKNVAVGLPANKTFTSIVQTDTLPEKELVKAFGYEVEKYVPMPIADAKADFVILDTNPENPAKTEILVSSIAKDYAESIVDLIEKTGLNIIAMEPEPLAMARSLAIPGAMDATMIVDFGEKSTDLVIVYRNKPRLVRSITGGFEMFVKAVANGLSVREDQARQFILKFGLDTEKVEGQVFRVLNTPLDNYVSELTKSMRFFQTQYINGKIGGIVLSGYASIIPLLSEYVEAKTGVATVKGNPWQSVRTTAEQQQALMSVASKFAVAIGLSERSND